LFKKGAGPFDAVAVNGVDDMMQLVVFWKGRHQLMWFIAGALHVDDSKLAEQCARTGDQLPNELRNIVTLNHDDWSFGCSKQAGIEGWFDAWRKRRAADPHSIPDADTILGWMETYDCEPFKKADVPQFKLLGTSKGFCHVEPIYPANKKENERLLSDVWFSCRAFSRGISPQPSSPMR